MKWICVFVMLGLIGAATARGQIDKPFAADEHTIGLWHFDNAGGSEVLDSSRNENHGKLFGLERMMLARYTNGKFQMGVESCDSGWVDIPDKKYYVGLETLTVEAWVFIYGFDETFGAARNRRGEIVTTPGYTLRLTEDAKSVEFIAHTEKGEMSVTSRPIGLDEWHHVAATYDGCECHIFLDGKLADKNHSGKGGGKIIAAIPARPPDRQYDSPSVMRMYSPVTIGGGVNPLNAVIDEVRISDLVRYK